MDLLGIPKPHVDLTNIRTVMNDSFYPLLGNKNRYLICYGGAGSGKSVFIAQKFLARMIVGMSKGLNHNFLCLRKTMPAAKKSVLPLFEHICNEWDLRHIVRLNKTDSIFHFRNGSKIHVAGLDDPEKIKSIFNVTSIWLEEANEFTYDDFEQLDLRMRGKTDDYYQLVLSFNPISKNNWIYNYFFDENNPQRQRKNVYIHHSNYEHNKFLDSAYIIKLKNFINTSTYHYNVYTKGQWGVLEGLVYENNWTLVDEMPSGNAGYAIDFGYNNPMTIVKVKRNKKGIYVKEIYYETKKTTADLINFIKKQLPSRAIFICDNAEPDRISELKKAGIRAVPAKKGKNSVMDGIDFLKQHMIHITKDSVNIIKEITSYQWKEKKEEFQDQVVPVNDHALDALRYYAWTVWGKKESEIKILWI